MRRCWDGEPSRRPTFDEIHDTLLSISVPPTHVDMHLHAYNPNSSSSSSAFEGDALDGLLRGR